MESLVREMQDTECGVPVRSQKLFLTSIPSAFMGYDLIEWLMERLSIEESEALNIANQLCLLGTCLSAEKMQFAQLWRLLEKGIKSIHFAK